MYVLIRNKEKPIEINGITTFEPLCIHDNCIVEKSDNSDYFDIIKDDNVIVTYYNKLFEAEIVND